jgi:hypothetical protein
MRLKFAFAALFLAAAAQVFSQTIPDAIESGSQLFVGGGISSYNDNFYENHFMEGATIWVDFYPNRGPAFLHGLGVEAEARDISIGRSATAPSNLREDTGGGGAIYRWQHYRNFVPYGKFQWEHASVDFKYPGYGHDTRDLYAAGVGFDYRIKHRSWLRAGFEEQVWQRLFQNHSVSTPTGIILKPRGATVGVSYAFNHLHFR